MKPQYSTAELQYMHSLYQILLKAHRAGVTWKKTAFKDGTSKIEFQKDFPIQFIVVNSRLFNKVQDDYLIGLS